MKHRLGIPKCRSVKLEAPLNLDRVTSEDHNAKAERRASPLADMIERVASGDQCAFQALYCQTASRLLDIARRILARKTDAEDVLQEAFFIVWTKAGAFDRRKGHALGWLTTIIRHCSLDRLRKDRPATRLAQIDLDLLPDSGPSPFQIAAQNSDLRAIARTLSSLRPGPRAAFQAVFFEELTHAEFAARNDVPLGTAKTWIRKSLTEMKASVR